MLNFITNLLPRLRQFSQSLDQAELFVDKPWVLLDEDGQQQTYIFQRGGKLIMSLDGKVQMGTWEYIAAAQRLLIDRGADCSLPRFPSQSKVEVKRLDGTRWGS